MFMSSEVNYTSIESSSPPLQEEVSNSDVENVAMSPDGGRIDVVSVDHSCPFDDRSSVKSGGNGGSGTNGHGRSSNDCGRSWTMAKVQVGYDITRKGERSLVVDGFKFTKSRDGTNNRVFWRCSRRECKATAVTVCDRVEHVRAIHAHEPPLAAEFFGGGTTGSVGSAAVIGQSPGGLDGGSQRCQLQEVRFNTSAANMRPRYRRPTASGSDGTIEEVPSTVKDISNSAVLQGTVDKNTTAVTQTYPSSVKPVIGVVSGQPVFQIQSTTDQKPIYSACNGLQRTPSVKEQVRDFILRNSNAQLNSQSENVSVAQFLISPASQTQFTPISTNSTANSTIFNFSSMQINASPNAGSDSTSDAPSHKSTPGLINLPTTPRDDNQYKNKTPLEGGAVMNQLNLEQIIQILLNKNVPNRQRSCSDSEWVAANSASTVSYDNDPQEMSPSAVAGPPSDHNPTTPARFIHWKKEKIRESETCEEQYRRDRKRRYDVSETPTPTGLCGSVSQSGELFSFFNSFRPTITHKLMGVMQKLSSELCPEEAVAQEVYEKCTAIKTCLETLEKLHSFMSY